MIVGTTLHHGGPYISPTFPREGLAALFSVEVPFEERGTSGLSVTVEHKNHDSTSWGTATTFSTITGTGTFSQDGLGLAEQIRVVFEVSGGSKGDYFHVIMAPPAWRPY